MQLTQVKKDGQKSPLTPADIGKKITVNGETIQARTRSRAAASAPRGCGPRRSSELRTPHLAFSAAGMCRCRAPRPPFRAAG
jgi:hypothetical protein